MQRQQQGPTPFDLFLLVLIVIGILLGIVLVTTSFYFVEEGFVGVSWVNGALSTEIANPGFHWKIPLIERCAQVQITLQTDKAQNIPCGTSGGVVVTFGSVEVVNRLHRAHVYETIRNYTVDYDRIWIFDKIHHFMNQFCSVHTLQEVYIDLFDTVDDKLVEALQADCSKWAPGIEIVSVRVTKPTLPKAIADNVETIEREKTQLSIANSTQRRSSIEAETAQKRAIIEAETVQKRAMIEAETRQREQLAQAETERAKAVTAADKDAQVSRIAMEREIAEHEAQRRISLLDTEAKTHHILNIGAAEATTIVRIAEAERLRFTPAYVQIEWAKAFANSTKIYFGSSIPSIMVDVDAHLDKKLVN